MYWLQIPGREGREGRREGGWEGGREREGGREGGREREGGIKGGRRRVRDLHTCTVFHYVHLSTVCVLILILF